MDSLLWRVLTVSTALIIILVYILVDWIFYHDQVLRLYKLNRVHVRIYLIKLIKINSHAEPNKKMVNIIIIMTLTFLPTPLIYPLMVFCLNFFLIYLFFAVCFRPDDWSETYKT